MIACTLGLFGTVRAQETSFYYDFNDASVDDWTKIDADGDGYNFGVTSLGIFAGYEGSVGLYSSCYSNGELYPDNYFVTNKTYAITSTSFLSFLHHTSDALYTEENFGVVVSENGTDWIVVWSKKYGYNAPDDEIVWPEANVSLADYAGKNVYLGFRHYNCNGSSANGIRIDNVKLYVAEGGETPETPVDPEPEQPTIPMHPASMLATVNGQNSITLTWEAVENATSYNVYSQAVGHAMGVTATEYTYDGLTAGTYYCFEVTAVNEAGESYDAASACATTEEAEVEEPEQPGDEELASSFSFDFEDGKLDGWKVFQGSGASSNNWKIGSGSYYGGQGDGYGVYSLSYGTSTLVARNYIVTTEPYAITSGSVLSWWIKHTYPGYETYDPYAVVISTDGENFEQIAEYTPGTGVTEQLSLAEYAGQNLYIGFYHYGQGGDAIVLDNIALTAGEGGETPETPVDPEPEQPVAPAAPANLVATANGQNSIVVTWDAVEGATDYYVYKNGQMLANTNGATTYTENDLSAGTEYCFAVQTVAGDLESELSETKCATTEAETPVDPEPEQPEEGGEVIVQIGEGTDYYTYFAPIYNYYQKYSISQVIYTAEEIGANAGLISSISYNQASGANNERDITVYLKNTDRDYFDSEWETLTSELCVYDGKFIFGETGWTTIELQEQFLYEGGNLLVCVIDKTGSSKWDGYDSFYSYETGQTAEDARAIYASSYYSQVDPLNITQGITFIRTSVGTDVFSYRAPQVKIAIAPAAANVKVVPETIAFGEIQLGGYWSEKESTTVDVKVKPIMTTVTNITCDNDFFVLPTIDLTADPIEFTVAYNKNGLSGEQTGNLIITYGDGSTKVAPMTATAYAPATADVFELAQAITFANNAYTDTPVFANLKDDYNLPKEANKGNTPDAVYTFTLEKEMNVTVGVTGTNAVYAIYAEDFNGEGGPKAKNNDKGNLPVPSEFKYDFNGGVGLEDFTMVECDGNNDYWQNFVDNNNGNREAIISYSYNYQAGISKADNYMITNDVYAISADSKLSFAAKNGGSYNNVADAIMVKVSTNGEDLESFTLVETVTLESMWEDKVVDLGAKFAELGLEYGNYYIALHHKCSDVYYVAVDDLTLTAAGTGEGGSVATNAIPYPAGKYYLVAAAEDAFTVNVAIESLEGEEPAPALPSAPANVVATANGQNSIIVTWDAVEGATNYYVYKDGQMWADTKGATTYTESGLVMGTEYCFAVQTVAGDLESELSEQACATTESLPENQIMVGTATTSYYSPFLTILGGGSWFEAIYKADEIGKAARIGEIAFSYNQGNETTADIKIYLAETTKTEFGSAADVTPESALTLVYTGTNVTLCDSAWETFVLDTPFNYSGENNLLLVVTTENTSLANKWNCYDGDANTVLIKGTIVYATKPVMMLTLAEGGDEPIVDDTEYRLVSTGEDYNALEYVYESETSNKVVEIRKGQNYGYGQDITFLQYDENGVLTGYEYGWAENGAIVKTGSSYSYSVVEYTYTDGLVTAYTETSYYGWMDPSTTEYTITRDAEGNITEVAYGTSKVVYTYENGKLVSETKSYQHNAADVTEYIIEYTYDENGNCTAATQYSAYDGKKVARNATEYVYATTIPAENVVAFAYPHAVAPAHANLVTKAISYEYQEDWQTGEITKGYFTVTPYVYNPEVVSEPLAPMALTVSAESDTELRLSWVAVESAEKFYIYKGEEFFAESESTPYYVTGLESATEYCFSVSGVNGEFESPKSEVVCGKTLDLVAIYPTEIAFGEVRVGNYWAKEETTVSVEINTLGKTVTAITCDNAFFTVPANIDLTASYIMFDLGYDMTAEAGEYTGNLVVTLEGGATVTAPVTATAYAPVTPDVFELAQEITFVDGVYTDTPDFATLHDDYLMPGEGEWNDGKLMDAVYTFTLETPSAVTVNVAGENAQYAIYKAEGFEYPTEETFNGVDRAITTAFSFNFNDGELGAFTIEDYDAYQDYSWDVEEDENGGYQLVSYSFQGWYGEDNSWQYYNDADERIITNAAFNITEKSVLTFDMNVNGQFEGVIIEVTKDGETFTVIENIMETSYSYEWLAKRINIGEKLAALGLEYGEYRISLYHDVQGYGELNIDNLVLAERELAFPEGTYFLFAAAEKDLAVEVSVVETEEVVIVPEPKAYRLESVVSFMETVYTYDEVFTNRVVEMEEEGITTTLSYNKAGQVVSAAQVVVYEGEEGEPVEEVLSSIEYTYNADGTLATYTETAPTPMGAMATTTTEYTYEDGKLVKVENADYEIEMTYVYNEDGTVKEIVEPYMTTVFTYENGNLVKTTIGWNDEETGEFFAEAEEVYTYANGNVVKQESYEYGSLYQVHEFFYDATVAAEDVYTFELPHMAIANVKPVNNNVLVKELSYYSYYDEEAGETIVHSYTMTVYNYNPAIEMAPVTPINFAAEVVDGVVELTWEAFADAETFTVYQDGEVIASDVTEGFYAVEGLTAGEHCFVVRAYNAAGASSTTNEACVTIEGGEPTPTVPAAPVVRVKEVTSTTVILEWDAVEGATKYALYSGDEKLGELAETIAGVQYLEPKTTYCFTVTAINEAGESAHSEEVCATTLPGEGIAENAAALNIYPNPAVDRVVIETEATIEAVSIYTLTGVMIYSEVDFNNNTIDVTDFASGVYVMKVRTENGEVVRRFIKK